MSLVLQESGHKPKYWIKNTPEGSINICTSYTNTHVNLLVVLVIIMVSTLETMHICTPFCA